MNNDSFSRNVVKKLLAIALMALSIHPMDFTILNHLFNPRKSLLGHRPGFTINLDYIKFMRDRLKQFLQEIKTATKTKVIAKVRKLHDKLTN